MGNRKRRPLTSSEVSALDDQLQAVLGAINAGELDASPAARSRLEGAVAALDAVLGRPTSLLTDLPGPAP